MQKDGVPKGSRTPVAAVKGRCPRPLDDGDNVCPIRKDRKNMASPRGVEPLLPP